jgi:hypothetical protein
MEVLHVPPSGPPGDKDGSIVPKTCERGKAQGVQGAGQRREPREDIATLGSERKGGLESPASGRPD